MTDMISRCAISADHAEQSVIGAIIMAPVTVCNALRKKGLQAAHFASDAARAIFTAADEMTLSNRPVDRDSIISAIEATGNPDVVAYAVAAMQSTGGTLNNATLYAEYVIDAAARRAGNALLNEATVDLFTPGIDPVARLERLKSDILTVSVPTHVADPADDIEGFISAMCERANNPDRDYIKTGFSDLDGFFGRGVRRNKYYCVGARPGVGKTTLLLNIASNMANDGKTVLYVTLEQEKADIMTKIMAIRTGEPTDYLNAGRISGDMDEFSAELERYKKQRLFVLADPAVTIADISARAREIGKVDAILIDYMSIIPANAGDETKERREQVAGISKSLLKMAHYDETINAAVIVAVQLNRMAVKEPNIAEIREAGAVEQDADAIVLISRDDYTGAGEETPAYSSVTFSIAKNRYGRCGRVNMVMHGPTGRLFETMEDAYAPAAGEAKAYERDRFVQTRIGVSA